MKKSIFVASILAASSISTLTQAEVSEIKSHVIELIQAQAGLSFVGASTVSIGTDVYRPQLKLVPANGEYTFVDDVPGPALGKTPGVDPGLEYHVIVELVDVQTGAKRGTQSQYFAKTFESGKLKVYFCDTTAVCSEDRGSIEIFVKGDTLEVSGAEFLHPSLSGDLSFISVPN